MDQLIAAQQELYGRIARSYDNIRKVGSAKVTTTLVQSAIALLDQKWTRFEEQHSKLRAEYWDKVKTHDYFAQDFISQVEDVYVQQRATLLELEQSLTASKAAEGLGRSGSQAGSEGQHPLATLPKISLPQFSGRVEDWPTFRDLFTSLICKEGLLTKVEKLHYLKACVKGDAEDLIKNLPVTDDNFLRAWTMLTSHYENKRLLVRAYFASFSAIPKMKSESAHDLRRVLNGMLTTAASLEGVGRPISSCSDLFVHLVVDLFDSRTRREWENVIGGQTDPPTCDELRTFLERKLNTLVVLSSDRSDLPNTKGERSSRVGRTLHVSGQVNAGRRCPLCSKAHFILFCANYKAKSAEERKETVKRHNLCYNCLGRHLVTACSSTKLCVHCSAKHHSSLHGACVDSGAAERPSSEIASSHVALGSAGGRHAAFLATARVQVADRFGSYHLARALIDPCSELSLVTESLAQRLRLKRSHSSWAVRGVGRDQSSATRGRVSISISSRSGELVGCVDAFVLSSLTSYGLESREVDGEWSFLEGLDLADPDPFGGESVELLLDVNIYPRLLLDGVRKDSRAELVAQRTTLGWFLSGAVGDSKPGSPVTAHVCSSDDGLAASVRRFWEQEEIPRGSTSLTGEEERCLEHFTATHGRLADGRYIVRLPFRSRSANLADTWQSAVSVMRATALRFGGDPALQRLYEEFMAEFLRLGHMSPVTQPRPDAGPGCFLPHHGIVKETGGASKIRVVFNGSARTREGHSLNDSLLVGPNLLLRLADVLLRWRRHRFVFATDVEKMYRQIQVHPEDRVWQRIVWLDGGTIRQFQLNTVTYGIASAPFLAIRCLQQLASDESECFPFGAAILREDMYVDDILSGASSVAEALEGRRQLEQIAGRGCFPLRKWAANNRSILDGIAEEHRSTQPSRLWQQDDHHSTLGLEWHPQDDSFSFNPRALREGASTRRGILSQVAQLFDPLGWMSPVTVRAKCIVQATWLRHVGWDERLPDGDVAAWEALRSELPLLLQLRIPRWIGLESPLDTVELHGFADASERAYATVLYLRVAGLSGVRVSMLMAKTKVAPLKQVSLPRLELCAASLLTAAAVQVVNVLRLGAGSVHLWTDSTITLGWIRGHPCRWTTYVANRVGEIQRLLPEARWHHVAGSANPADCASRGMLPSDLIVHSLWWNGPDFLREERWSTGMEDMDQSELPEQRRTVALARGEPEESEILTRHSSFIRLLRVTAWMRRWRAAGSRHQGQVPALTPEELRRAEIFWIRHVQAVTYAEELRLLNTRRPLRRGSSLIALTPFQDEKGILRVGGRLKHAVLSHDERHPIILPPRSHLSKLVVDSHHRRTLHGGVQLTLSLLRRRYWIPRGRQLVKALILRCPPCLRWRAASPQPQMANLPRARASPCRTFMRAGVDYAGPIMVRASRGRGHKAVKAFIAIFICFSSRAVHIEAVSDYSSDAFIAAFRRFISRRGICRDLYSDCGTNFVGADAQLRSLLRVASQTRKDIADQLASNGTRWHFNPPGAPHFGGLWEAAVKSAKHHLRRVVGSATLTFEELSTLLSQVEACLNSRPLQALSDDPEDFAALTPGHFLIGEPLCALPEPPLVDEPSGRLDRWRLVQQMRDHLWKRWSEEYLTSLMQRSKWRKEAPPLRVGQLCLVRSEGTSPARWPLARIRKLHAGDGGEVRVVEVRTATTALTRPVVKIIPLPCGSLDDVNA